MSGLPPMPIYWPAKAIEEPIAPGFVLLNHRPKRMTKLVQVFRLPIVAVEEFSIFVAQSPVDKLTFFVNAINDLLASKRVAFTACRDNQQRRVNGMLAQFIECARVQDRVNVADGRDVIFGIGRITAVGAGVWAVGSVVAINATNALEAFVAAGYEVLGHDATRNSVVAWAGALQRTRLFF